VGEHRGTSDGGSAAAVDEEPSIAAFLIVLTVLVLFVAFVAFGA
jgi:hypothetical protein